jgi:tetraacyldisaccharide 4'-kinase
MGFIEVLDDADVNDVGDENFMIKKSFKNINVFSSENRSFALDRISKKFNDIGLIILDDAMQHRKIKCDLNILLTKFEQPFYNDFIFPFGNLREPRIGYERANIIIVTKCPNNLTSIQKEKIIKKKLIH